MNYRDPSGSLFRLPSGMRPRQHAALLDKKLGFRIKRVENKLNQKYRQYDLSMSCGQQKDYFPDTEAWIGLDPDILQTPYCDILSALSFVKAQEFVVKNIVDIGAAYGRVAFVKEALFPEAQFIGFEVVKKRQQEAQRVYDSHQMETSKILYQDVLEADFELPKSSIYFIYDFSESSDVSYILEKIIEVNDESIFLIAHGDRTLRLLEYQFQSFIPVRATSQLSVFYHPY